MIQTRGGERKGDFWAKEKKPFQNKAKKKKKKPSMTVPSAPRCYGPPNEETGSEPRG